MGTTFMETILYVVRRDFADPELAREAVRDACESIAHQEYMDRNFPREHPNVPRVKDSDLMLSDQEMRARRLGFYERHRPSPLYSS